jgi:hypothetical protein
MRRRVRRRFRRRSLNADLPLGSILDAARELSARGVDVVAARLS